MGISRREWSSKMRGNSTEENGDLIVWKQLCWWQPSLSTGSLPLTLMNPVPSNHLRPSQIIVLSWLTCPFVSLTNFCMCVCVVTQLYPAVCNPLDCSPPDSFVHGILQARILEWVAITSSRGSSWSRDWTHISYVSCIGRWVIYPWHHLGSPAHQTS